MSENYAVQVSLSAPPPAQYAKGAMANFRGDTVDEVYAQLEAARDLGLLELASEVESIWTASAGLGARTVDGGASVPPSQQADSGSSASSEPVAALHVCEHGKRTYRTGEKNGKKWEGWFCPEKNRSQQCEAQWAN